MKECNNDHRFWRLEVGGSFEVDMTMFSSVGPIFAVATVSVAVVGVKGISVIFVVVISFDVVGVGTASLAVDVSEMGSR